VNKKADIPSSLQQIYGIKYMFQSSNPPLPSGPYFLSAFTGKVYQAYRLYNDENQAFLYGVIPAPDGSYRQLSAHIDGAHTSTVGVPSRLYFTPTAAKPFSGYRLAVKDIYDVAGLKTGCGSRAYYQTYPPKNTTAYAIQRLIDMGMVIVGKVKTSQFANGETATDDWVDIHSPYNPRGDGYQDGSSSSTGPASSLSSYDWLDISIGSDTGGSMRGPASKCGLFGNRPSHGSMSLQNVMPLSPAFDTAGIFSRDAIPWAQIAKLWYPDLKDYTEYPKKLLFPVDVFGSNYTAHPPANGTADAVLNAFLKKLEAFLGVSRTDVNLTTMWTANFPATSFDTFLNTSYVNVITTDQISLLRNSFFQTYAMKNGGRVPFVNPAPVARWAYGLGLSNSQYQEALANKTIYQSWVASQVLRGNQSKTCSESILVYPQSVGATLYRNAYLP
jgi:Asp-tRNA(Asn)/Glu-tRNA(Gln) amidotransferase A subunit family amidase